jgi:hypothetical protein
LTSSSSIQKSNIHSISFSSKRCLFFLQKKYMVTLKINHDHILFTDFDTGSKLLFFFLIIFLLLCFSHSFFSSTRAFHRSINRVHTAERKFRIIIISKKVFRKMTSFYGVELDTKKLNELPSSPLSIIR